MGDSLSQEEIEQLMQQLMGGDDANDDGQAAGAARNKKIKEYDFRRPNKFAKEHLRALSNIHEVYARYLTNFFSAYLRTLVSIEVISIEEMSYYEFNNSIANPTLMAVIDFLPLKGYVVYEVSPTIIFAMVDRILGGQGTTLEKMRPFTEIETSIIERIINQMLSFLKDSWENVAELRPRLDRIETNSQFAQIVSPNDMVALVTLDTKIGEVKSMVNICIPYLVLEPVMSKLTTKFWFGVNDNEVNPENMNVLQSRIEKVNVPFKVVLGHTKFTVEDFLSLQKGDVIQLDTEANANLSAYVGSIYKFNVKPGIKKNRVAVKITDVIRKEDLDNE